MVALAAAVVLAAGLIGAGAGAALAHPHSSNAAAPSASTSTLPPLGGGSGGTGSGGSGTGSGSPGSGVFGGGSGSGSGNGSGSAGSGGVAGGSTGTGGAGATSVDSAAIAAKVDPAVVDIITTLGYQNGQAAGTGMVLTPSGVVLTNNHVVRGATSITGQIDGQGTTYPAKVIGTDPTADVAVIQLQGATGLPTVQLGDATKVSSGDPVVAIGNALNRPGPPTVTSGTITALDQSITASDSGEGTSEQLDGLFQTNALLQPGDSGGPLVNAGAQVIGMDTAASNGTTFSSGSNQGFAIPINSAKSIADQIVAGHASATIHIGPPGFLGVQIAPTGSSGRNGSGIFGGSGGFGSTAPATNGAVVEGALPGTPAETAGISAGDTIVSINGATISSPNDLSAALGGHRPGDTVTVGWVDQNGQRHTASVRLANGPAD